MNAPADDAPLARPRETPGATPQAPLRLLQTARRPAAPSAPPRRPTDWLDRMAGWLRAPR